MKWLDWVKMIVSCVMLGAGVALVINLFCWIIERMM